MKTDTPTVPTNENFSLYKNPLRGWSAFIVTEKRKFECRFFAKKKEIPKNAIRIQRCICFPFPR